MDTARNPEPTNVSSSWSTVYSTATLPLSKNGEVIWGINNSHCELTIEVNMEDAIQLTTEALHSFGLNYCSHLPGSSPTQPANLAASLTWRTSHLHWHRWTTIAAGCAARAWNLGAKPCGKSPACQRQNINVCICLICRDFRTNYWFVTSTVVIWFVTVCFVLTSWISSHH